MKTPPDLPLLFSTKMLSLVYAGLITGGMFIAIPLTQIATEDPSLNHVQTVSLYKVQPPPPPIELMKEKEKEEEEEENLELKKEFEKLTLASIDMALNVGAGGTGASNIYIGSFEIDDSQIDLNLTFEISELDKPPIPILQIAPMYPMALKRSAITGRVVAEFIVTKEGRPIKINIIEASNQEFMGPVVDALRRWQFEPGIKEEQKVNTRVRIPFFFSLDSA